jgi:hypothetical protein
LSHSGSFFDGFRWYYNELSKEICVTQKLSQQAVSMVSNSAVSFVLKNICDKFIHIADTGQNHNKNEQKK